jgi:hypothetical protein
MIIKVTKLPKSLVNKETEMRMFVDLTPKNAVQVRVAALVLLAIALMIPQLTWADHASDHPYGQFDDSALISLSEGSAALVEKYKSGELVFHTPGRPDDRAFSISPGEAYTALVETYREGELVYHAPGRRDDSLLTTSVNSEQVDAAFLAANPETIVSRRHAASGHAVAEAADSARWVALGEYYADRGATFLSANPEIMVLRRFVVSQQGIAAAADSARWVALGEYYADGGATFLTVNPEVRTYRRFVQDGCSEASLGC